MLDTILPIVLGGGQSRRFGRDKLREPLAAGGFLVDRPIGALREVFGPRVALVGPCDPAVAARADFLLDDVVAGAGPLGGNFSGLLAAKARGMSSVFVLAGDLIGIDSATVRSLIAHADQNPLAAAIIGSTDRPQPCIALYRLEALEPLQAALIKDGRSPPLVHVVAAMNERVASCPIAAHCALNINTREDLIQLASTNQPPPRVP